MTGETSLGRDAILAATDSAREFVAVPEWGGGVYVQAMSGLALDRYEQRQLSREKDKAESGKPNLDHARAELAVLTVVDAQGQPLFTLDDIEALSAKSGRALNRVVKVAMRLNGLSGADLEQLAKN